MARLCDCYIVKIAIRRVPLRYHIGMRNPTQLHQALQGVKNVAQFAKENKLPLRTVWRIRSGGTARRGTLVLIDAALSKGKP